MKKRMITFVVCLFGFSGCSTIHFDNDVQNQPKKKTQLWHHNFALGLYEWSPVVNLNKECGEAQWVSVKTETTFVNGLAGELVNIAAPIWYPKTVEIICNTNNPYN